MSDKRLSSDARYFRQMFKHELRKVTKSMSGLFRLAHRVGIKTDKSNGENVMSQLFHKVSQHGGPYISYRYQHINNVRDLGDEIKEKPKQSKMDEQKQEAEALARHELATKISNKTHWNINVNLTAQGCGVVFENGSLRKIIVPIMYAKHMRAIGTLGSNKALVWCKPYKHDTYKCWVGSYLTFSYSNGNKKLREVPCYIMKDTVSGIVYYHTDYRLCAMGMRRAIGRKIASRIG